MKKRFLFWLIFLGVSFVALGVFVFLGRDELRFLPWQNTRSFEFPRIAVVDLSGEIVALSDKGDRRLTAMRPDGSIVWQLEGESRGDGFYRGVPLGFDASGDFFFLNQILNFDTGLSERSEVRKISPAGVLSKALWYRDNTVEEQVANDRIPYAFEMQEGRILYFINDSHGNSALHEVDPASGADKVVHNLEGVDAYSYSSSWTDKDDTLYLLSSKGIIEKYPPGSSQAETLFGNGGGGYRFALPGDLNRDAKGDFVLLDSKSEIVRVSGGTAVPVAFDPSQKAGWYVSSLSLIGTVASGPVAALPDQASNSVLIVNLETGEIRNRIAQAFLGPSRVLSSYAVWSALVIEGMLLVAFIVILYLNVMRHRTPLLLKQLSLFVPLIVAAMTVVSVWVYNSMFDRYFSEVENRQKSWSYLGARIIRGEDLDALSFENASAGDLMEGDAFKRMTAGMGTAIRDNSDSWNSSTYDYVYFQRGSFWYVFDQFGYFERYIPKDEMRKVLADGQIRAVSYDDPYSAWLSGLAPITRADGSVAGVFEITVDKNIFNEIRDAFVGDLVKGVAIGVFVLAIVATLSTYWLLLSIRSLKTGAIQISRGNYEVEVRIHSKDEIEDLGNIFNQMSSEIRRYVEQVTSLNKANSKFVPVQFLDYLGKSSILDIRLGDQVQREMTVLFSDIRSFTTLSEKMSPEENFNFINHYLKNMGPVIRTQRGFIDKYIGDAIMALFPHSAEDALRAALDMFKTLKLINSTSSLSRSPGENSLEIGIGLHSGKLMLGIVGEEERYDGTVISDTVNLASRLESLTKFYAAPIIVSSVTLGQISDRGFFETRHLDRVRVKGKSEPVDLHEVFIPEDPVSQSKMALKPRFASAFSDYAAGKLELAAESFERLAKECPDDAAPRIFLSRIQKFQKTGIPQGWDGTTVLDAK